MLVLSRKIGEQIVVGDRVVITVQRLAGNRVSLGIEAPPEVSILRGELRPAVEGFRGSTSAAPGAADGLPAARLPEGIELRVVGETDRVPTAPRKVALDGRARNVAPCCVPTAVVRKPQGVRGATARPARPALPR